MNKVEMKLVKFREENIIATSGVPSTWNGYRLGGLGANGSSDDFLHLVTNGVEDKTNNLLTTDYNTLTQVFNLSNDDYGFWPVSDDSDNYGGYNGFYSITSDESDYQSFFFVNTNLPSN